LREYPVDLESGEAHRPVIRAALRRAFGWSEVELQGMESDIERLISNLTIKHAVSATFVELALCDGPEGLRRRAPELMRAVYGDLPLRPGDVDLVVSASAIYFCLAYRGECFLGPDFDARPPAEQSALLEFLARLRRDNVFATNRFPSFGAFDVADVSGDLLDALHAGACRRLGDEIPRRVVVETFATMISILPTELADQYLVHDAWGHGWQEALCEFEWLYGETLHIRERLAPDTGRRAGRVEGRRLGDAFVVVDGVTRLDEEALVAVVEADLRHRIRAVGNTFLSEVLADLVEHKYLRFRAPTEGEFPTSSLLPKACLKVDLSLKDLRAYGRAWSSPYRRFVGRRAARLQLSEALIAEGRPLQGLHAAVDLAAEVISRRFGAALRTEYSRVPSDSTSSTAQVGVVQRLGLCTLALDAELAVFLDRSEAVFERERAERADLQRWQVPEACIDLLVLVLAWFYEQERDAYIWHLDELLRVSLGPSLARFGAALRAEL
jgi:hypothetical protein